ncbi:MAG: membrane protein insertase YidC [Sphingobium sp.]|nr:membrane protein insertase YidC [Sphingobium sp.]MBP8671477.1 membrane protein insertase YidC [Sphingobium sp.]MBP9158545.1 membrane protein insertase YidC [Sphingobium sp.]MCC6940802.1 membrane protein insertase YidC [Novosphingobium sp.]
MDDKRNLILAVLLTGLILFGWPYVAERLFPGSTKPAVTQQQSAPQTPQSGANAPGAPALAPSMPTTPLSRATVLTQSPRVVIETPKLTGSIALKGARIDDITLPTYRETVKKDSPPIRLFSPAGTQNAYFAGFGWAGEGVKAPDANTVWQASGQKLTPTSPVTLRWNNGVGQLFEIALSVDANYMITARQSVTNRSAGAVAVRSYGFISRAGHSKDPSTWTIHTGPIGVFNEAANYDIEFETLDEDGISERLPSTGGWIGFTDHYWLAALVPDQKASFDGQFRKGAGQSYQADYSLPPVVLGPGKALQQSTALFVGAKEVKVLEGYQDAGIALFDRSIDWGWFYWFEKPIFALLHWLFTQIGNFGVAIICLTFVVRALMFPVAQKQFASMAAMRAIQPKMKALQEKHKDDKPKLQQELMDLYKKEKVNPFSGCVPIFLQIPIFFALYKVLQLTIEMRHQPFALWIKDLSAPDPLHVLNLFGLLPFTPPAFLGIGILAIILGITMWLQFRLNPAPMDEMQKQIFALMPWMMMFIMAPFAAGLLIYWITSNILTIAQQKWLYSRHPQLKQAPAQ